MRTVGGCCAEATDTKAATSMAASEEIFGTGLPKVFAIKGEPRDVSGIPAPARVTSVASARRGRR